MHHTHTHTHHNLSFLCCTIPLCILYSNNRSIKPLTYECFDLIHTVISCLCHTHTHARQNSLFMFVPYPSAFLIRTIVPSNSSSSIDLTLSTPSFLICTTPIRTITRYFYLHHTPLHFYRNNRSIKPLTWYRFDLIHTVILCMHRNHAQTQILTHPPHNSSSVWTTPSALLIGTIGISHLQHLINLFYTFTLTTVLSQ